MNYQSLKTIFFVALFIGAFYSCSDKQARDPSTLPMEISSLENLSIFSPANDSGTTIYFEETHRFGELYKPAFPPAPSLGFGPKYAVDSAERVYFTNPYEQTIQVFNADGSHKINIGQPGNGPGDFNSISAVYIQENNLMVFDGNLQRIQIFETNSFKLKNSFITAPQKWKLSDEVKITHANTIKPLSNGLLTSVNLNDKNGRSYYGYFNMDFDGESASKIIIDELLPATHTGVIKKYGSETTLPIPSSNKEIVVADGTQIYSLNTEHFLIKEFNLNGEYQRAKYYPTTKDPLEKEEVLSEFHPNLHSVFDDATLSEEWPAVAQFLVDDEHRFWVSTIIGNHSMNKWYVLENSGELIGTFFWPKSEPIQLVKHGKMYTTREDSATEATSLVSYKIGW